MDFSSRRRTRLLSVWRVVNWFETLIIVVDLDYLTGIVVSGKEGKLSSSVGLKVINSDYILPELRSPGHANKTAGMDKESI
jgi:hypothetical protein